MNKLPIFRTIDQGVIIYITEQTDTYFKKEGFDYKFKWNALKLLTPLNQAAKLLAAKHRILGHE